MQRIGRYEVLDELGRGSMGAVYKARDPQIGRTVAIKIILTANLSPADLEHYKQRFVREAQAAGQMAHPGIVTIHDIAEDETGQPFLVMEFIEGTGLEKLLQPGAARMPFDRAVEIAVQVAEALDYAHRRGVIHRDIKPANILLAADGRAKIADFGIAKMSGTQMTQAGQLMGTPAFMSPEQFSGGTVDARSDLFSLGAMIYWMLTGERPFGGETLTVVSFRVVYTQPIPPRMVDPSLPPEIETILSRCLAKNPDDRYLSCRELVEDLRAVREGRAIKTLPLAPPPAMDQTVNVPGMGSGAPPGGTGTPVVDPEPGRRVEDPERSRRGGPPEATLPVTAEATTRDIPGAGVPVTVEAAPVSTGFWTRGRKIAAAVLLLVLLLAAYSFWPSPQEEPVATEPEAPPPQVAPKRTTPKKKSTTAAKPAAQEEEKATPTDEQTLRQQAEDALRKKAGEILKEQSTKPPWSKGKGKGHRP